ncbi:aldehyde reductase protein [Phlyctema vagabunda]|uniref:Aldehyde reductase protein n=1 Tax=Phlyctema vagabunda TaxID=108571 RepID=A0ABR4PTS3_9HELO
MSSAIPLGSTVLVTGINGFVGSHVVDQLLLAGYKVRGTVRDPQKAAGLVKLWNEKYGEGKLELITVKDMAFPGAFDKAVAGVSGIAHVASNMSLSPDPNTVIPEVLAGIRSIIDSAILSPSVKRFVYTSSSTAITSPSKEVARHFTVDSWNDAAVAAAWAPPPYTEDRALDVYFASKTEAEKMLFKYSKEKNVAFNVASVLPCIVFGKILDPEVPASTADMLKQMAIGKQSMLPFVLPTWFVDVQDVARLHVAALTNSGSQAERIFAFSGSVTHNDVVRAIHKAIPGKALVEEIEDPKRDLTTFPRERATELLQALGGTGWTSIEESVRLNLESL